jgi:hypothetical protein
MEKKVEKTKERIGVNNIDNKSRKELLNKFIDAGGKVIDEKSEKKYAALDRKKQQQFKKQLDEKQKKTAEKYKPSSQKQPQNVRTNTPTMVKVYSNFMSDFRIRFKLWYMGVTQLNGIYINFNFFSKIKSSYASSLMSIQIMFMEIFKRNPVISSKVTDQLDKYSLIYFETIQMMSNIYDIPLFDRILDDYVNYTGIPVKTISLKDYILILYKKLYILYPYQVTILNGFDKAAEILSKTDKSLKISSIRKNRNDLYNIFYKFYPKLHWLFCYYAGKMYAENDPAIEKILYIKDTEKPGRRKIIKKTEEELKQIDEDLEDDPHNPEKDLPENIKSGLLLMSDLDMHKLRINYDKEGLFAAISDNDKILITYLLFREFDNEYSFVLTTSKIKFNTEFGQKRKSDFRANMNMLFDEMRKCNEGFKNYVETVSLYEKAREQKPVGNSQYIEYTKRLESLSKKKDSAGRDARVIVQSFMDRILTEFKVLIEDMNSQIPQFITNPQDILEFMEEIEGVKKISGMKLFEILNNIYNYCSAFSYRLSFDGDLCGGTEFTEEEKNINEKKIQDKNKSAEQLSKESETPKSMLEELDDIL